MNDDDIKDLYALGVFLIIIMAGVAAMMKILY